MNIVFTRVRWKNFLSTGNVFTELELDSSGPTLISGKNGSGKSTLLDAIVFGLYGKPFRNINKPQLVNSINQRDMLVEVEFRIGANEYLVRRGMKPNVFDIVKNGELVNQSAANRDYQRELEETILKINLKAFTQIVVLGSANYVPFMKLSPAARREVIEDLLDIQVFSTMSSLLKDRVTANREAIIEKKAQVDSLKIQIEAAERHNDTIRRMKSLEVEKLRERAAVLFAAIETDKTEAESLDEAADAARATVSDKSKMLSLQDKLTQFRADMTARLSALSEQIAFYHENDDCPTCRQRIADKEHLRADTAAEMTKLTEGLSSLRAKVEGVEKRLSEIASVEAAVLDLDNRAGALRAAARLKRGTLLEIKSDLESAEREEKEIDTDAITRYSVSLAEASAEYSELVIHRDILAVCTPMLKDGGIKASVIKKFVPLMNKLIGDYLAAFDLFVDFHLDESFNETIKSRFRDNFSYASFSEGEKLRLDLAILFAWRSISKKRNSISTNLLVLDELLDGAADADGVESLLEILKGMNSGDSVFLVSHRGHMFEDKFEKHIRFAKTKNFSHVVAD